MTQPWRRRVSLVAIVLAAICRAPHALAAEAPEDPPDKRDFKDQLPHIPPLEPADALETFRLQPGFKIEQVAAEPLVTDPVALAFDADGRLFVVEMRGYSEQPDDLLSQVRLLEDTDADGRFDKSTVFVDKLSWATAVACYDGGVFIGDAPDILFCKDTDGDGRADVRETVLAGFGTSNVQGLLNTFLWGLDNRIHGATSSSGGNIVPAAHPDKTPLNLSGRDFAFDPRTLDLAATSGGGQHGMTFDEWGRKFVCSNSDHIQQVMLEDRYLARNPYLSAPQARISIAADGPQAVVYRTSPIEPWRIVRTRLRVAGEVPGPIEGGGRPAGYFTGATGITIYRGDAWPDRMRGIAVIGDVGSNLVHRKRLEPRGLEFLARRIDERCEFVASRDIWFRPVQFANAPDGTLYIADMYREVIEHPLSLPPVIKQHLDLTSGRDRGRIYRIVPDGFQPAAGGPLRRWSRASTAELVALLAHPNGWHRETASRLLYERRDADAVGPLVKLAAESKAPLARMHALYALDALAALTPEVLQGALADEHPRVREHAIRLSERLAPDSPALCAQLCALVADDDSNVRYQLAFTLGEVPGPGRNRALARLARRDAADRWVRLAVQSSLAEGAGEVFAELSADESFRQSDGGRGFLEGLARQVGLANRKAEIAEVLNGVENLPAAESGLARDVVRGLGEGLVQGANPLGELVAGGKATEVLGDLLAAAGRTAADERQPLADRVEAIRTLALAPFDDARDLLAALLDHRQADEVQVAALAALGRFNDPGVAPLLLLAWPGLSPRLRVQATEAFLARTERTGALLDAIERGDVSAADIEPARLQLLSSHGDAAVRDRALKLLAGLKLGRRQEVVQAYRGALDLAGDPMRGKLAFQKHCAACHRASGVGHEIGPNLATVQNRGAEAILVNVLDPSREVNPQYVNYVLITDDGLALTGMIAAETATSVTLKRAENATDTVLRIKIDELASTGLSIMPEGVEKDLDQQAMADLIAYLLSLK